jgi:hypothetical protein
VRMGPASCVSHLPLRDYFSLQVACTEAGPFKAKPRPAEDRGSSVGGRSAGDEYTLAVRTRRECAPGYLHLAASFAGPGLLGEVLYVVGHPDGAGEELTHPRLAGSLVDQERGGMLVVGDS